MTESHEAPLHPVPCRLRHVGNAAAVFPLQRWPRDLGIHTVQFSNHTGYGAGRAGIRRRHDPRGGGGSRRPRRARLLRRRLSGYMGGADIGEAILETVTQVRAANPQARYCSIR